MRTPSQVTHSPNEFQYYTPSSVEDILFIRGLQDEELADPASLFDEFPPETNRSWIEARCAEERYDRGLLTDRQFDCLMEEIG